MRGFVQVTKAAFAPIYPNITTIYEAGQSPETQSLYAVAVNANRKGDESQFFVVGRLYGLRFNHS